MGSSAGSRDNTTDNMGSSAGSRDNTNDNMGSSAGSRDNTNDNTNYMYVQTNGILTAAYLSKTLLKL